MTLQEKIKNRVEKLPPLTGVLLNCIPFRFRLGHEYLKASRLAGQLIKADHETRINHLVKSFNCVYSHFRHNNGYYKHLLQKSDCSIESIEGRGDISNIPVLTKSMLREVPVDERSLVQYAYKQFNTGGTSGYPLSFFLEKNFYSREWAHMHYIWNKIGYTPGKTKITIRGKNLNSIYQYNFNQNEFLINAYHSFNESDYHSLYKIFKKYNTEFIHGYPSSIYSFLKEVSVNAPYLLDFLKRNIKGIMLGSEFPSPVYRDFIENVLTGNTVSWYGHTEGAILAAELSRKYEYVPFLSYGFTEAVKIDDQYHLVGTSFYNFASPFIRYDTEDIIKPNFDEYGFLQSFEITEGRLGEFIIDKNNRSISLTALIFGRHHKLFNKVNFVQVKQNFPGEITIYYSNPSVIENPSELFDTTNLNLEIFFRQVNEPFKTPLGKVPLLIK